MKITQMPDGILDAEIPKPSNEEMQHEFNYILAEQLTKKLLDSGLITQEEFDKIMVKNRASFSPFISKITPQIT